MRLTACAGQCQRGKKCGGSVAARRAANQEGAHTSCSISATQSSLPCCRMGGMRTRSISREQPVWERTGTGCCGPFCWQRDASCHLPELQAHPVCAARLSASRRPCFTMPHCSLPPFLLTATATTSTPAASSRLARLAPGTGTSETGRCAPCPSSAPLFGHSYAPLWLLALATVLAQPAHPLPPLFGYLCCRLCSWLLPDLHVASACAMPAPPPAVHCFCAMCIRRTPFCLYVVCCSSSAASFHSPLQRKYPPRNFPMPPEGCTNEAVKTLIRCGRTH